MEPALARCLGVLPLLLVLVCLPHLNEAQSEEEPHCIWMGQCHQESEYQTFNCNYTGPPVPITDDAGNLLEELCPHIDNETVCCTGQNLKNIVEKLAVLRSLLNRCPTCLNNMQRHMCDMTCSKNQSRFMEVEKWDYNSSGVPFIREVNIYLSRDYMEGSYNSCRSVQMPSTGRLALDMMCGQWGSDYCDFEKMFEFMGHKDTPYVPFQINYFHTSDNEDIIPEDLEWKPCEEIYDGEEQCSCMDCQAICSVYEPEEEKEKFTIIGLDGVAVIMGIIFIVLALGITLGVCLGRKFCSGSTMSNISCFCCELGHSMETALEKLFTMWGIAFASSSAVVICIVPWLAMGLMYGALHMEITTDPIELWAASDSQARLEKDYFDIHFEPFFRTEQVYLKAEGLSGFTHNVSGNLVEFGPAFNETFLKAAIQLQEDIMKVGAGTAYAMEKICFAPMVLKSEEAKIDKCVIQSIGGFFDNSVSGFDRESDPLERISTCFQNSYDMSCLAPYGGNIEVALSVGGYDTDGSTDYRKATGLVMTFLMRNPLNKTEVEPALEWEKSYIAFMKDWTANKKPEFMSVAFSSERSIEDEISRESEAEISTVIISYVIMFVYITLALGQYTSISRILVDGKFTLGFAGIVLVIISVVSSLGIFGYAGVPTTLLTIEVIPFLVLAVGVDNIFIIVQTHQREGRRPGESHEHHVGRTLGKVGPGILLTTLSESCCFLLGALSDMPAVRTFALYAGVALLLDFLLQMTVFVSLLTLDSKRQEANRFDIFCFAKSKAPEREHSEGYLYRFMRDKYAKFLMFWPVRWIVMIIFAFCLCACFALVPHLEPGLDQKLSVPKDSYVTTYFEYMDDLLSMGPNVYFVLKKGLNFTKKPVQNAVCGGQGCNPDSLNAQIYVASTAPGSTYILRPASSWLDDYFDWISLSNCCEDSPSAACSSTWKPDPAIFPVHIPEFLKQEPTDQCPKGGLAAYGTAIDYVQTDEGISEIEDTYFMAYHTTLKTSEDYYEALRAARKVASNITQMLRSTMKDESIEVFPYSVFYVFYEQYLDIWPNTLQSLGISLAAVFVVSFILLGFNIISAILVLLMVVMIIVDISGIMYLWNVTLNAVSLVNLVMAVGISVEFCSHIIHAFTKSSGSTREERSIEALASMGSSVLSGITITKFLGIIVLAFAKSQIFEVFYFRMYLAIVICGAAHGLILLPVLLSYVGPNKCYRDTQSQGKSVIASLEEPTAPPKASTSKEGT